MSMFGKDPGQTSEYARALRSSQSSQERNSREVPQEVLSLEIRRSLGTSNTRSSVVEILHCDGQGIRTCRL